MLSKEKIENINCLVEKLIIENGISKLNISQLCISTSISKKTFYKHFGSKKIFIEKYYLNMLRSAYINVIQIIQERNSFFEKFEKISQLVEKRIPLFNNKAMEELKKFYPDVSLKINYFKSSKIIPLLKLLIVKAQQRKIINDFDPQILINIFFGSISTIYNEQNNFIENQNTDLKFREVFEILLSGILAKKGKSFLKHKLVSIN